MSAATEAVVVCVSSFDAERGAFLIMEGAERFEYSASAFQVDLACDDINQVYFFFQGLEGFFCIHRAMIVDSASTINLPQYSQPYFPFLHPFVGLVCKTEVN